MSHNPKPEDKNFRDEDFENDGAYADDDIEPEKLRLPDRSSSPSPFGEGAGGEATDGKTPAASGEAQPTMTAKQQPTTKPGNTK